MACWGDNTTARPHRRPGPSARSAPAATTPAGCGPTARWPAGGGTTTARPRRRPAPSARSAPAACTPAGCRPTARWPAGGTNDYGQATPPAGTFSQVSAGGYHTCGLKTDGTLACWGRRRLRPGHAAGRDLHPGQRRRLSHLRAADRRHAGLLGATTTTARPRRRPGPSPRSARAATTPAG